MLRTLVLLPAVLSAFAWPLALARAADAEPAAAAAASEVDSKALERRLQQLTWPQFQAVLAAIPKLKSDVAAYGELGWQIVRENYMHYGWKRNIDRLDEAQKKALSGLIEKAKRGDPQQ